MYGHDGKICICSMYVATKQVNIRCLARNYRVPQYFGRELNTDSTNRIFIVVQD